MNQPGVTAATLNLRTLQDSLESLELPHIKPLLCPVSEVVFSLYIAFATLVMLNLVTGVFVEGRSKRNALRLGIVEPLSIGGLKSKL